MKIKRKKITYEEIEIPEAICYCGHCKGTGRKIVAYREPPFGNEYMICFNCRGKGYLTERDIQFQKELGNLNPCMSKEEEAMLI